MFSNRTTPQRQVPTYDVPYQARDANGLKKRILVLPFLDEKLTRSQKVKDVARASVVRQLSVLGQFVVVNNQDFPQDFSKFLTENNEYDLEAISKVASGLGVAAVLEGKILEIRAKRIGDQVGLVREIKARIDTTVRLRVANTKSTKVILSDVRKSTVETVTTRVAKYSYSDRFLEQDPYLVRSGVVKAFRGFAGLIVKSVDKISWEGRVALVSGDKIYVNAGRLSGLQMGDILKVTEVGAEVFDPDTGIFIGHAPGRMKGTLEVVSYFGKDGAVSVIHSGSGFNENDRVELY